eukprot:scaffold10537_cov122-Isochrysis_galbana.AAC.2
MALMKSSSHPCPVASERSLKAAAVLDVVGCRRRARVRTAPPPPQDGESTADGVVIEPELGARNDRNGEQARSV